MEKQCQNKCPNCEADSENINWEKIEIDDSFMFRLAKCKSCKHKFTETYNIDYVSTQDYDNRYWS